MKRAQFLLILLLGCASQANSQFGILPAGQQHTFELSGIRGEYVVQFPLPLQVLEGLLPDGVQLTTLAEAAETDSVLRQYLTLHPQLAKHVPSRFAFVLTDTFLLDQQLVHQQRPAALAFWWVEGVQLALWHTDSQLVETLRKTDPTIQLGQVTVRQHTNTEVTVSLRLPDVLVQGQLQLIGTPIKASYALPRFQTIRSAAPPGGVSTVYTYYGHSFQECAASWQTTGTHILAQVLQSAIQQFPDRMRTYAALHWRARAGIYLEVE